MKIKSSRFQLGGQPQAQPVVVEKNEVVRNNQGKILKVDSGAPSHDEGTLQAPGRNYKVPRGRGGVVAMDLESVLSDSQSQINSGKRSNNPKDAVIKILPGEAKAIGKELGLKLKVGQSLSPSKLFLKLKDSRDKRAEKLIRALEKTDPSLGQFAEASGKVNQDQLVSLPDDNFIYDLVFGLQEDAKEQSPIDFEQGPMQQGGLTTTGYLNDSPDRFNDFNIIPMDDQKLITMDGVDQPLLLMGNGGEIIAAQPNSGQYRFDNSQYVMELPLAQQGGNPKEVRLKNGSVVSWDDYVNYYSQGKKSPNHAIRFEGEPYVYTAGKSRYTRRPNMPTLVEEIPEWFIEEEKRRPRISSPSSSQTVVSAGTPGKKTPGKLKVAGSRTRASAPDSFGVTTGTTSSPDTLSEEEAHSILTSGPSSFGTVSAGSWPTMIKSGPLPAASEPVNQGPAVSDPFSFGTTSGSSPKPLPLRPPSGAAEGSPVTSNPFSYRVSPGENPIVSGSAAPAMQPVNPNPGVNYPFDSRYQFGWLPEVVVKARRPVDDSFPNHSELPARTTGTRPRRSSAPAPGPNRFVFDMQPETDPGLEAPGQVLPREMLPGPGVEEAIGLGSVSVPPNENTTPQRSAPAGPDQTVEHKNPYALRLEDILPDLFQLVESTQKTQNVLLNQDYIPLEHEDLSLDPYLHELDQQSINAQNWVKSRSWKIRIRPSNPSISRPASRADMKGRLVKIGSPAVSQRVDMLFGFDLNAHTPNKKSRSSFPDRQNSLSNLFPGNS